MTTRRRFLSLSSVSAIAVAGSSAQAQRTTLPPTAASAPPSNAPMLSEQDPQAVALGYVADARKVDKAKFPKYAPPQRCAVCQLYQGPQSAPTAPCAIFGGKQVAGPGWCNAYVPRTS